MYTIAAKNIFRKLNSRDRSLFSEACARARLEAPKRTNEQHEQHENALQCLVSRVSAALLRFDLILLSITGFPFFHSIPGVPGYSLRKALSLLQYLYL